MAAILNEFGMLFQDLFAGSGQMPLRDKVNHEAPESIRKWQNCISSIDANQPLRPKSADPVSNRRSRGKENALGEL